ncbi:MULTISPECIES: PLP-dependent aminotransferase family protein [Halomonadaceae]|nr:MULTISPECIES: PLP-dependent aminotransferase family protein [Halomonas]
MLCLTLENGATSCLQEQLRVALLETIRLNAIPTDEALPSCRKLSKQLGISRNTVAIVYEGLVEDGYLVSRPRSGYYLHENYHQEGLALEEIPHQTKLEAPSWSKRFTHRPSNYQGVLKPSNWMEYDYPFIYGQLDTQLFPLEQWRDVNRRLLSGRSDKHWLGDRIDQDDPLLIEQLRKRVLPKRGIFARSDEILITMGSQNALFLIAQLLLHSETRIGLENPGYREAVNVFARQGAKLQLHGIDNQGILLNENSKACDYLYVMPSHQVPTGITMSHTRREELIAQIQAHDQIVIEDDYDAEMHGDQFALPALKASRAGQRVIYMSSFSKALSPGLRLGYIVADSELVEELRALRRMMYRHPPSGLQHQMAQFFSQGHYERYLRFYTDDTQRRRERLGKALERELEGCRRINGSQASAFWLEAPNSLDTQHLAWQAAQLGVLIEPGFQHFFNQAPPRNFLRLGFGAIDCERIDSGISRLAQAFDRVA